MGRLSDGPTSIAPAIILYNTEHDVRQRLPISAFIPIFTAGAVSGNAVGEMLASGEASAMWLLLATSQLNMPLRREPTNVTSAVVGRGVTAAPPPCEHQSLRDIVLGGEGIDV
jgi:hypothetical protein